MIIKKSKGQRAAIEQAFKDGKQIQWRFPFIDEPWKDTEIPTFNWGMYDYRVKPEE